MLASRKHNPAGAAWFAGSLAVAMASLWPVVGALIQSGQHGAGSDEQGIGRFEEGRVPRLVGVALRIGVVCGVLVGVERLAFQHFSSLVRKGHELIALVAFLAFYAGVVGLHVHRLRQPRESPWSALLVLLPLLGVGLRECWLYFAQRHRPISRPI